MKSQLLQFLRIISKARYIVCLLLVSGLTQQASADSGLYIGGSVGTSNLEFAATGGDDFDDDYTATKIYGGYNFDIVVIDLAIEGGYVNFGDFSGDILGSETSVDLSAWSGFGLVGLELGPIGVFAKAGMVKWDADSIISGLSDNSSGSDPAYGIGARFSIASVELRAEYELFDIELGDLSSTDLSMASIGAVWTF